MINEEHFDGFYVALCPNCPGKRKEQIPFKKDDKFVICPICGTKLSDKDIEKKIIKPIDMKIWDGSSIATESLFNY